MDKITLTIDRAEAYIILQALDLLEKDSLLYSIDGARKDYGKVKFDTADNLAHKIRKAYSEAN